MLPRKQATSPASSPNHEEGFFSQILFIYLYLVAPSISPFDSLRPSLKAVINRLLPNRSTFLSFYLVLQAGTDLDVDFHQFFMLC